MNTLKLIGLIELSLLELEDLIINSMVFDREKEPVLSTRKVLIALKKEVTLNSSKINERLLRAMHDIGMSAYKDFENTPMEEAINNLVAALYKEIPEYKMLKPLRMDFGNGEPV